MPVIEFIHRILAVLQTSTVTYGILVPTFLVRDMKLPSMGRVLPWILSAQPAKYLQMVRAWSRSPLLSATGLPASRLSSRA